MHGNGALDAVFCISCENDIDAVFQRLFLRKRLKGLSAHDDNFSLRHFSKHLLVSWNAHQQTVLVTDCPIVVHSRYEIHICLLPLLYYNYSYLSARELIWSANLASSLSSCQQSCKDIRYAAQTLLDSNRRSLELNSAC